MTAIPLELPSFQVQNAMDNVQKIFVDVGGYHGESARAALDPRFGFDVVYCFEPVASCHAYIRDHLAHPRLRLFKAGLLDRKARLPVYQAGTVGASVFADAPELAGASAPETCEFWRATEFFEENVPHGSAVWMKLNCEGAECGILIDLIASGEATKLTEVLLDLDARKMPSASEYLDKLKNLLPSVPFSYHYPEEVQYTMVTNFGSIRNWLIVTGAIKQTVSAYVSSMAYQARCVTEKDINGYYKIRLLRFLRLRPPAGVPTKAGACVGRP